MAIDRMAACSAVLLPERGRPTTIAPPAISVEEKCSAAMSLAPARPMMAFAPGAEVAPHQVAGSPGSGAGAPGSRVGVRSERPDAICLLTIGITRASVTG